jgi:hypothetical protein
MEKITKYRNYIKQIINEYGNYKPAYGHVQVELICDTENDHYQVVRAGWNGDTRIYGCILHFDIINNKIWIQYNGTEIDVANELVELGVPKEDIVLAFHAPYKRQYTGFAIN